MIPSLPHMWYQPRTALCGPGGAAPWTPASLGSNLVAWYDADTGVTTSSGNITQWTDRTGNSNHTLVNSGTVPFSTSSAINSKAAVVFTAANTSKLKTASSTFQMGTGTTGSCWALCQMLTGTGGFGRLVSYDHGANDYDGTGRTGYILRANSSNGFNNYRNNIATPALGLPFSLATTVRLGVIFNGTIKAAYLNGSQVGTTDAFTSAWIDNGNLVLGGDTAAGAADYWDGALRELIITKHSPSAQDITDIDTYLAAQG